MLNNTVKITTSILAALLLSSCAKDAAGKSHYVGPRISGSVSLKGVTVSATIYEPVTVIPLEPEEPIEVPHTIPAGKEPPQ